MNVLTQVPMEVRKALYWIGYVLGVVSGGIATVWGTAAAASPDIEMPMWLLITQGVLVILVSQLNLLAGANVPSFQDVIEGEVE